MPKTKPDECLFCHDTVPNMRDDVLAVCTDCAVTLLPSIVARAVVATADGCAFFELKEALTQFQVRYWEEAAAQLDLARD